MLAFRLAICAAAALALSGCTFAEMMSIRREFHTSAPHSQLIDAKQRSILVGEKLVWDDVQKKWIKHPKVCAEPSPDALTVLATSGGANFDNPGGTSASLSAALGENGASIGLRTQTIQLLRDRFYRLCEAYISGAIDEESYDIEQRRLTNQMVGILAIEQLTGAIRAPSVILTSSGSAAAATNLAWLIQRRGEIKDRLDKLPSEIEAQEKVAKDHKDAKEGTPEFKQKTDAEAAAKRLKQEKADLEEQRPVVEEAISKAKQGTASVTGGGSIEAIGGGTISAATASAVAQTVENIAKLVLNADYGPQVCLSYYRFHDPRAAVPSQIATSCKGILDAYVIALKNRAAFGDPGIKAMLSDSKNPVARKLLEELNSSPFAN